MLCWAASDSNAYVANLGSNNVSVIDTATNMVTVGSIPFGVAITPDGLHAYVTNFGSGNVSVIATASNMVTATVTVGTQPNGVAISPICPAPSLTISKSHTGKFTQGLQGTYTITVDNTGPGATDGTTVNVHDTLPAGLTAASITGIGWSCTLATLSCTRSHALPAGTVIRPSR